MEILAEYVTGNAARGKRVMWLILLDRSGSMAEEFSTTPAAAPKGRVRSTDARIKWDAAICAVVDEIASLGQQERVCLIAFSGTADVVFDGTAALVTDVEKALATLTPAGDTNLAAALERGAGIAASSRDAQISVVVITDGLAEEAESREAAVALAARVGMIEVLLIDPTEKGQALARAIAVRGRVVSVVSASDLREKGQDAARRHAEETARVDRALARVEEERVSISTRVPAPERLGFTVGYSARPMVDTWSPLSLFLHLCRDDLVEQVRRRLERLALQARGEVASATASTFTNRGTWLTLTPRVEGTDFDPPRQVVAWYEDVQEIPFRFRIPAARHGESLSGEVEIATEAGLWLASLPINMRPRSAEEAAQAAANEQAISTAQLADRVFASYSHADRAVVEACAAAYKALGIHLYIDRSDLIVGDEWHPGLLTLIDRSDVFQLYWSQSSRDSKFVQQEWEYALARRSQKTERFMRGVYWKEPMPEAPQALATLHFGYLDLQALGIPVPSEPAPQPAAAASATAMPWEPSQAAAQELAPELVLRKAPAIQPAVLTLTAGETRQRLTELRHLVQVAVAFLESTTGLRYYPVPTLLVDDFVVRQSRAVLGTVDEAPKPDAGTMEQPRADLAKWTHLLQGLTLEFHVRQVPPWPPSGERDEHVSESIAAGAGISDAALYGMREFGEWGLLKWVWDYLFYPWELSDRRGGDEFPRAPEERSSLSEVALRQVDELVKPVIEATSYPSNRARQVRASFERPSTSDPSSFDERVAWTTIGKEFEAVGLTTTRAPQKGAGAERPAQSLEDWRLEVTGTVEQFAAALDLARAQLAALLPKLDRQPYTEPGNLSEESMRAIGYAVCMRALAEGLRHIAPSPLSSWYQNRFDVWVVDTLYPSWKRARDYFVTCGMDEMLSLSFGEFLAAYLARMQHLFAYGKQLYPDFYYKGTYDISEPAASEIRTRDNDLGFAVRRQTSPFAGTRSLLEGRFESFVTLFQRSSERLLTALKQVPSRSEARTKPAEVQLAMEASTWGIFAPENARSVDDGLGEWAVRKQLMPQSTLPSVPRVLFCTRAVTSAVQKHTTGALDLNLLSLAVLVHEHFHALAETAAGSNGLSPNGPRNSSEWSAATPVNEALAAWMECHALRRLGPLLTGPDRSAQVEAAVWEYVRSGLYPTWPYRGAEEVESMYRREGVAGVRQIIDQLRDDPGAARARFDQLMGSTRRGGP